MVRHYDDPPSDDHLTLTGRRRWTVERSLLVLTFICSVIAVIFGAGMQWAKTSGIEEGQADIQRALKQDFVRADVYAADQRRYTEAIDRLTAAVDRLSGQSQSRVPRFGPQ